MTMCHVTGLSPSLSHTQTQTQRKEIKLFIYIQFKIHILKKSGKILQKSLNRIYNVFMPLFLV